MHVVGGTVAAAVVGDLAVSHVGYPWPDLIRRHSFARMHHVSKDAAWALQQQQEM
jgi:hypothetical protein